jgi:hypothetical protein
MRTTRRPGALAETMTGQHHDLIGLAKTEGRGPVHRERPGLVAATVPAGTVHLALGHGALRAC